jgi:hypothetical protein
MNLPKTILPGKGKDAGAAVGKNHEVLRLKHCSLRTGEASLVCSTRI